MRKNKHAINEIYHIFNRGTEKRNIFLDQKDLERFFQSMLSFNSVQLTRSLYQKSFQKEKIEEKPLVNFIAYNLLPNHFHFILEQVEENGISKFIKRLLGGYSWYFNNKYKRSGSLFQGPFKSKIIDSNEYLLHLSVYVNLNDKLSSLGDQVAKLGKSSWEEYINSEKTSKKINLKKNIIIEQFPSKEAYKKFALSSLEDIKINKEKYKDLEE